MVMDAATAVPLDGECSSELLAASLAAGPEGCVTAYLDPAGVWRHVPAVLVSLYRDQRGEAVRCVYVDR